MRTATLIIAANICAFSLGVVMSAWLLTARPDLVAPAMRAAPVASPAAAKAMPPTPPHAAASSGTPGAAARPGPVAGPVSAVVSGANAAVAPLLLPTATAPPPTLPAAPPDTEIVATAADMALAKRAAAPSGKAPAFAAAGATRNGRYLLQAGAFQDAANATRLVAQLKKLGYDATITPSTFGAKTLLLVRIGGFGEYGAVAETASAIRKRIGIPALIVKIAQ